MLDGQVRTPGKEETMKFGKFFLMMTAAGICAVPAVADEHASEEAAEKVCIKSDLVRNFDALDDQHVFIQERSRNYYLLTMRNRCAGLRHAQVIALSDTTSRICSGGFGELYFRESGIGRLNCRIDTIEPVENKDEAHAIVDERAAYKKELEKQKKAEKKMQKEMKKAQEAVEE